MQPPPGGYPPNPPPGSPAALYGSPPAAMGSMPLQHPSGLPPHRGPLILVLGIIGVLMCQVVGVVAWVFGNKDLAEMDAGRMDPSGRDLTRVGKILGMISVGLMLLGMVLAVVFGMGILIAAFR